MNIKTLVYTNFLCLWLSFAAQAQLGTSQISHDHNALLSVNYEPFSDYHPVLLRFGKVINPKTIITANVGYAKSPFNNQLININLPQHLLTAGIESEYFFCRQIDKYQLGFSIYGRYQYELYDQNIENISEHHFDLNARAYYPFRYKKVSLSPFGSYGISDWSSSKINKTFSIGGIIGLHFSDSDYCYLSIYTTRYDKGSGDYRTFVSLGLLW